MDGITIRRALEQDADVVMSAGDAVFDGPPRADSTAAMLASPAHRLILALAGDRVVGMAAGALSLVPDKPPSFLLDELGVDADWRRRGIGRALVRAAMAEARAMGCSVLWVSTEGDNGPARALYRMLDGEEMTQVAVYSWGL